MSDQTHEDVARRLADILRGMQREQQEWSHLPREAQNERSIWLALPEIIALLEGAITAGVTQTLRDERRAGEERRSKYLFITETRVPYYLVIMRYTPDADPLIDLRLSAHFTHPLTGLRMCMHHVIGRELAAPRQQRGGAPRPGPARH